jgi:hypothetical protein
MGIIDAHLVKRLLVIAAVLGLMVAGFVGLAPAAAPEAVYFNGKIVTLDAAGSPSRRSSLKYISVVAGAGTAKTCQAFVYQRLSRPYHRVVAVRAHCPDEKLVSSREIQPMQS